MDRPILKHAQRYFSRALLWIVAVGGPAFICGSSLAVEEALPPSAESPPPPSVRSGGLLEESFNYHRQSPLQPARPNAAFPPANGWYGYGFPVQSYRWGWFGAERNYPRVIRHTGYYGDCVRTAYRYGN